MTELNAHYRILKQNTQNNIVYDMSLDIPQTMGSNVFTKCSDLYVILNDKKVEISILSSLPKTGVKDNETSQSQSLFIKTLQQKVKCYELK